MQMLKKVTQTEWGKNKLSTCAQGKGHSPKMEEGNTHTVRNGRRNRTLYGIQKSRVERQQPKSRVKPTASPNRGLKPRLFHIHSRNRSLEAALPARCMHKTKKESPDRCMRKMNRPPPARPFVRVNRPGKSGVVERMAMEVASNVRSTRWWSVRMGKD